MSSVTEKSASKKQQRFMGMVHALQKGDISPDSVSSTVKKAAGSMTKKSAKKYASTKHKNLPTKKESVNIDELRSRVIDKLKETIRKEVMGTLEEGVDDPGILKMVFLAGGPGSGKSFTAAVIFGLMPIKGDKDHRTSFTDTGLKVVNSDTMFVHMLKKNGIDPKDLDLIKKNDPETAIRIGLKGNAPDSIRAKAKRVVSRMQAMMTKGRLGMLIDGTGHDYAKIVKQKKVAEAMGYDTYMVFVDTTLDVALQRNKRRDRVVPEDVVKKSWADVQKNKAKFKSLFGSSNFSIVDNNVYGPVPADIMKATRKFMSKPIQNPVGKKWVEAARALKKAGVTASSDKR